MCANCELSGFNTHEYDDDGKSKGGVMTKERVAMPTMARSGIGWLVAEIICIT